MAARVRLVPTKRRITAASPVAPVFNARGVVPLPAFTLSRPAAGPGCIEFTIRAHPVGGGLWIAQPTWVCRDGSIPLDGMPLHDKSPRFRSRSEAVDDAMSRGLRMVRAQKHRKSSASAWASSIEALCAWMAEAIEQVRAHDETLPLRGLVGIDLFAGGLGGLSMGMVSMGMKIDLACEIDAEARAVYAANIRPRVMHDDICTLDGREHKADVVTMGLLCQAFSPAGKGLGFADPKLAKAYKHAMRVLGQIDAKVVIIECARRFLTLEDGKHADKLIEKMMLAGYRVQHCTLNAEGFGVAQSRERSILVCTRIGLDLNPIVGYLFPEEHEPTSCVADIMDADLPATVPKADITPHTPKRARRKGQRVKVGHSEGRNHQGYRCYCPSSGPGVTLTASGGGRAQFSGAYRVKGGARPLTPREACCMQGLPEWAEQHPTHRQAMKHAGNVVAVPLARELVRQRGAILGSEKPASWWPGRWACPAPACDQQGQQVARQRLPPLRPVAPRSSP